MMKNLMEILMVAASAVAAVAKLIIEKDKTQ